MEYFKFYKKIYNVNFLSILRNKNNDKITQSKSVQYNVQIIFENKEEITKNNIPQDSLIKNTKWTKDYTYPTNKIIKELKLKGKFISLIFFNLEDQITNWARLPDQKVKLT
jgi:BioD-like phosphotransacetylase family protein